MQTSSPDSKIHRIEYVMIEEPNLTTKKAINMRRARSTRSQSRLTTTQEISQPSTSSHAAFSEFLTNLALFAQLLLIAGFHYGMRAGTEARFLEYFALTLLERKVARGRWPFRNVSSPIMFAECKSVVFSEEIGRWNEERPRGADSRLEHISSLANVIIIFLSRTLTTTIMITLAKLMPCDHYFEKKI